MSRNTSEWETRLSGNQKICWSLLSQFIRLHCKYYVFFIFHCPSFCRIFDLRYPHGFCFGHFGILGNQFGASVVHWRYFDFSMNFIIYPAAQQAETRGAVNSYPSQPGGPSKQEPADFLIYQIIESSWAKGSTCQCCLPRTPAPLPAKIETMCATAVSKSRQKGSIA